MHAANLARKAKLLKASGHFINHTELAPLIEKQSIFLVLAGKKPVSQATSSTWVKTDYGAHAEPDDTRELQEFLGSLGLAYRLSSDDYTTNALVSLEPGKLDDYIAAEEADDMAAVGRLFGYPQTAIEAFARDDCMEPDEQDKLIEAAGISVVIPSFRFSKTHAQQELAILKDWYQTLKQYDLA